MMMQNDDVPTTNECDSSVDASSLDLQLVGISSSGLGEWSDGDWSNMLNLGSHAFSRALQEVEDAMEQTHTRLDGEGKPKDDAASAAAPLDTHAFEQWAHRIAHLHVLNVSLAARAQPADPCVRIHDDVHACAVLTSILTCL
jgi:hypothetical protein